MRAPELFAKELYLFLTGLNFLHSRLGNVSTGGWRAWYLLEVVGLVAVPMVLFAFGSARRRLGVIRLAGVLAILGVIVNRLNVSVIAFKWNEPAHYVPSWMEVVVAAAIVCVEIWVFRWIVYRMPVMSARPAWARIQSAGRPAAEILARAA